MTVVAITDAHEGPVYVAAEDAVYFTTVAGAIKRLFEVLTREHAIGVRDARFLR